MAGVPLSDDVARMEFQLALRRHGISDQAADAIHNAYPRAEVLVHADPREVVTGNKA